MTLSQWQWWVLDGDVDHDAEGWREMKIGRSHTLGMPSVIHFFKAVPFRSEVTILMESADVTEALGQCEWMIQHHFDPFDYTMSPQWREMMTIWRNEDIQGRYRPFKEEQDAAA
jgi:hypothetical protein